MQNPLLTNVLLAVIAALLLVQVIQNGMNNSSRPQRAMMPAMNTHPTVSEPTSPSGAMGHSMFEQALVGFPEGCDRTKTLASCDTPAAQAVREELNQLVAGGAAPRQVFDYVINKYGMSALTEQAQKIRGMRKGSAK